MERRYFVQDFQIPLLCSTNPCTCLLWGDCWLLCQQDQWYSIFDFWFICFFLPFDEENKRLAFPLLSKKFLSPLTSLVVRAFYVKHSACLLDYLLLFTELRAGKVLYSLSLEEIIFFLFLSLALILGYQLHLWPWCSLASLWLFPQTFALAFLFEVSRSLPILVDNGLEILKQVEHEGDCDYGGNLGAGPSSCHKLGLLTLALAYKFLLDP